jgi:hypothetical protein
MDEQQLTNDAPEQAPKRRRTTTKGRKLAVDILSPT